MFRVFFVFISFVAANLANALDYFTTSDFSKLPSIEVVLDDKASDACWTNLTESREYAEEKVLMAGSKPFTSEERYWGRDYLLIIMVNSSRNEALGLCYGDIEIDLITGAKHNGFIHEASLFNLNRPFMGYENVNRAVIDAIQVFFGAK